jgi:formylglycine-generating enzyme required for sulfatase activity
MSGKLPLQSQAGKPHPCCVPSVERSVRLAESRELASRRRRTAKGSTEGMLKLDGGRFWMGAEDAEGFPLDGEGPIREVTLDPFFIDAHPVTNEQYREFVNATGYKTEAQRYGWSFVFHRQVPPDLYDRVVDDTVLGHNWWCKVTGADWAHPEGPDTSVDSRLDHPAGHVSWNDAKEYARWAGKRLPTDAEFEYAARGGLDQRRYAWGDELTPGGTHMCNIWQGRFPYEDTAEDGYAAPCPVTAFPANGYGMYSAAGNVWEWVNDWFSPDYHVLATPVNPQGPPRGSGRVMRGGSFLCHDSYCNRYRVAARTSNTPDSSTTNLGFRCARDL